MIVRERFPISEVVRRTGVPPATVHHYLRLGLLPHPKRSSVNRFLYDERHVQGLRLIRLLRDRRGLSLKVIRRVLPDLLGLEETEAFRPEMWDQVVGLRTRGRRSPGARLLDAAVQAFGRSGYGDVNVDDICRAARIAKGSFYRHFRSKEDLFFAVAEAAGIRAAESFARALPGGSVDEGRATAALADALEPLLWIFLDLFARASQGNPRYRAAARRVFGDLAYRVGEGLGGRDPMAGGVEVLQGALAILLRRTMGPIPASVRPASATHR